MEKFAVDLDKVLDDFELNEDQAERFAAKSKPSTPLPKVQPQPLPTQPLLSRHLLDKRDSHHEASERSLRRINLLDADFAPDPHPQVLSFSSSQEKSTVVINDSSHPVYSARPSQPPLANGQPTAEEEEAEEEKACSNNSDKVWSNRDILEDSHGACLSPPSLPPTADAAVCPPYSVKEWNQGRRSPEEAGDCHSPDLPVSNTVDGCDSNPSIPLTGDEEPVRSSHDCLSVDVVVPMAPDSDRPVLEVGDGPVPCSVEDGESLPQRRDCVELEQPVVEEGMGIAEDVESEEDAVGERVEEGERQLPSQHEETRPISFKAEEELSDVDFAKYLEELEQEEEEPGVVHEVAKEVVVDSSSVEAKREDEGVKVAEDCREEAWEEEGSGRALLDGAIGASLPAPIASSPPPCAMEEGGEVGESCRVEGGEEGRAVAAATPPVQRPGTLPLVAVDALPHPPPPVPAAKEEEEEDSSIPIPLVIGPPGATPANPWPPSDISAQGAALRVNESASGSLPCVVGVMEGATVGRTMIPPNLPKVIGGAHPSYVETQPTAAPEGEVKVEGHLSSSSSSSSEADEAGVGNDLEGGGEGASGEGSNDSSSPEVAPSGPVEQLGSVGMSEGDLSSSPVAQADIVVGEESRMSHGSSSGGLSLGDVAPFWVPDADAPACMLCMSKFTLIKRRHHCRACGKVLCSKCCSFKARLAYMDHSEARVCAPCQSIIAQEAAAASPTSGGYYPPNSGRQGDCLLDQASDHSPPRRSGASRPDPNNPMEYCSTVPPLEQVGERARAPPPSVMVPVGVLKREGSSSRSKGETTKQVMFSDGIRPGGDLTDLDRSPNVASSSGKPSSALSAVQRKIASRLAKRATGTGCPPEYNFEEGPELDRLVETLTDESQPPVAFALSKNFFVLVKIITMDCCVNRVVWSFTTRGMRCVGQDEVVVLLDWLPSDKGPPRDIFRHLSALYEQASKGNTVTELGHSTVQGSFLGSHSHGGFLYIRATFQCLRRLPLPPPPYLFGLLLHRMETPWAKVFPIRVMLRLGAEFRYYPCPLVGVRGREPVYHQIGHTIMNLLSDFRNFTYVLPSVRGMVIHMEERQTSILLPKNRLSMVERALDDSDDHVLALSASFSTAADSHLVCVQGEPGDASSGHYHTQAINIQNKPRKVTGASFVVFNGALKVSSKLTAKSSIVEDGLMVQVLPDTLVTLRNALRNGEDFVIPCGPISPASPPPPPPPPAPVESEEQEAQSAADGAVVPQSTQSATQPSAPDEVIIIRWVEDDKNFNIGVKSPIDGMALDGVPSIRVHNGTNYMSDTKFIRWTEVFLIQQNGEPQPANSRGETMDVNRISESIAHAVCLALHPYLDMLWSHALTLIAVRATLGPDSEGYEAGCGGSRLPPIYMNSLDNELIGVLHRIEWRPAESSNRPLVLELLFHLMEL
ncbi:zinc finger FYVE domain-containing protein 9 isoform X2 [Ischnura elegans]|uniref:zinc finger FYVE domain-containing protein 9 isoform X2 n=1 Tax=Ischnura elegans TaxID=197161 RepID=UPI001ED8A205|nr:zinc finger FYVE domain-containing protein 9 isoform X2 [Ischnura elegans]